MTIQKTQEGNTLTLSLEGRLDTMTSPELTAELDNSLDGVKQLLLDFGKVNYISSAGLRVLVTAYKAMEAKKGIMKVINPSTAVQEVLDLTGYVFLTMD